jgi:hypothetical protein
MNDMPTVRDTAELLALKKKIENLSHGDRLRVAAACVDAGKLEITETLTGQIVDELRAVRLLRNRQESARG